VKREHHFREEGLTMKTIATPMGELKEGDIVWTYGLRVQLGPVRHYEGGIPLQPASSSRGKVLNPEKFVGDSIDAQGARWTFGGIIDSFTDPHWTIQSIDTHTWAKEVS